MLSRHLPQADSVLVAISDDDAHLQAIFELDAATNDRLLAGQQLLPGIGVEELVFGVPHAAVVNAAFCHPHPLGSRFNGPNRGAWYAAFALETSQAEVGFHKTVQLAEIGRFEDTVTYDDYTADFSADFHDLRSAPPGMRAYLDPDTLRRVSGAGRALLEAESLGVIYPSVRHAGGTCVACFRPALVDERAAGENLSLYVGRQSRAGHHRGTVIARFTIASTRSTVSSIDSPVVSSSIGVLWDRQRRGRSRAVRLVARGHLGGDIGGRSRAAYAVRGIGGAPARALFGRRVEIDLHVGVRKHHRTDVASFHDDAAALPFFPLALDEHRAHLGKASRRSGGAIDLGRPDGVRHVVAVDDDR